uniref:Putative ovule protein n=1 Tax=Solanum chacoense TaxID=4108 RepID=A0A0V0H148_SOLCH
MVVLMKRLFVYFYILSHTEVAMILPFISPHLLSFVLSSCFLFFSWCNWKIICSYAVVSSKYYMTSILYLLPLYLALMIYQPTE